MNMLKGLVSRRRRGESMISSKRGQTILDMLMVVIVLFVLGVVAVYGYMIFGELNDEIQADADMHVEAKNAAAGVNTNYPTWIDGAFFLVLILLWGLLIVTSFMIDSHPIFFVLTVMMLLFVFVIGMVLANSFQDIITDDDLSSSAASFPIINWVMGNYLIALIVMGLTAALSLYAKNRL